MEIFQTRLECSCRSMCAWIDFIHPWNSVVTFCVKNGHGCQRWLLGVCWKISKHIGKGDQSTQFGQKIWNSEYGALIRTTNFVHTDNLSESVRESPRKPYKEIVRVIPEYSSSMHTIRIEPFKCQKRYIQSPLILISNGFSGSKGHICQQF